MWEGKVLFHETGTLQVSMWMAGVLGRRPKPPDRYDTSFTQQTETSPVYQQSVWHTYIHTQSTCWKMLAFFIEKTEITLFSRVCIFMMVLFIIVILRARWNHVCAQDNVVYSGQEVRVLVSVCYEALLHENWVTDSLCCNLKILRVWEILEGWIPCAKLRIWAVVHFISQ